MFVFRLLTSQELTGLINYLQDKRDRLVRGSTDSRLGKYQMRTVQTVLCLGLVNS